MAFVLVNIAAAASTTNTVSITVPAGGVPAGALIIAAYSNTQQTVGARTRTVTDSASNSYAENVVISNTSANALASVFSSWNTAALTSGQHIQCVASGTPIVNHSLSCFYVTGALVGSDPHDSTADHTNFGASNAPAISVQTPAVANSLSIVVLGVQTNDSQSFSNPGGWSTPPNQTGSTSGTPPNALRGGTKVLSTGETYTASLGSTANFAMVSTAFKPAATISGSLSRTLGTLTSVAAGAVIDSAALSKTLDVLTVAATGEVVSGISGALDATLDALTSAANSEVINTGSLSTALAPASATATGEIAIGGAASPTLAVLTTVAAGEAVITGGVVAALVPATLIATGDTATVNAALAETLGSLLVAGIGTAEVTGAAGPALGALAVAAAGDVDIAGAADLALAPAGAAAAGGPEISGALAATLGNLVLAGQLVLTIGPVRVTVRGQAPASIAVTGRRGQAPIIGRRAAIALTGRYAA